MRALAAEAAAATKRGSLDGPSPVSAKSGLRSGLSGHSSGAHNGVKLAPSSSDEDGAGTQSAPSAEATAHPGDATTAVAAASATGDVSDGAAKPDAKPHRKLLVVKKKRTASGSASLVVTADSGATSASDTEGGGGGGGLAKRKKIVRKVVKKVLLRNKRKPADGADGNALSTDSVPITIDSGGEGGVSVETPRRPPALRIKPQAAADRRSEDRFLLPSRDQKRASADGAPPPPSAALPLPLMVASSLRGASGRDSSLDSRALVVATSPAIATAASSEGTSTARAAFLSFFGRGGSATPGTAATARSGARSFFGTARSGGAASGARPVSGRADFRSHFVGDRRAGAASATNANISLLTAPRSARRRSAGPSARIPRLEASKEDLALEELMEEAARDTRLNEEGEDTTRLYINYFVRGPAALRQHAGPRVRVPARQCPRRQPLPSSGLPLGPSWFPLGTRVA
jgi:hypothetical protein